MNTLTQMPITLTPMPTRQVQIGDKEYAVQTHYLGPFPGLSTSEWPSQADEKHENPGMDYAVFLFTLPEDPLGRRLYVDTTQGEIDAVEILGPEETAESRIADWEWADSGYRCLAEWMAAWNLDPWPYLTKATPQTTEECMVWCEPQYLPSTTNAPLPGLWEISSTADGLGERVPVRGTFDEVLQRIEAWESEHSPYEGIAQCDVLAYGQMNRDLLTIIVAPC